MILYIIGGLLALSALTGIGGYFKGKAEQREEFREEQAEQAETQNRLDRETALRTFKLQEKRDGENLRTADRLVVALGELRNRPVRLPEAAAPACLGGDGTRLSGPDAEFLEREAARANRLRTDLNTCQAWITEVGALIK